MQERGGLVTSTERECRSYFIPRVPMKPLPQDLPKDADKKMQSNNPTPDMKDAEPAPEKAMADSAKK